MVRMTDCVFPVSQERKSDDGRTGGRLKGWEEKGQGPEEDEWELRVTRPGFLTREQLGMWLTRGRA